VSDLQDQLQRPSWKIFDQFCIGVLHKIISLGLPEVLVKKKLNGKYFLSIKIVTSFVLYFSKETS